MKPRWIVGSLFVLFFFAPSIRAQQGPPSATLTWDAVSVPTPANLTYKLQRATAVVGPYTQVGNPITATSVTDTTVTRGTTYWWRLISSCPATGIGCGTVAAPMLGDSAPSASASATIPNAASTPPAPTNLTITNVQ